MAAKKEVVKEAVVCACCSEEAKFFHSKCCCAHFEGVIIKGRFGIVCEECSKFVAWLDMKK